MRLWATNRFWSHRSTVSKRRTHPGSLPPRFQIGCDTPQISASLDCPSVTRTFTDNGAEVRKTGCLHSLQSPGTQRRYLVFLCLNLAAQLRSLSSPILPCISMVCRASYRTGLEVANQTSLLFCLLREVAVVIDAWIRFHRGHSDFILGFGEVVVEFVFRSHILCTPFQGPLFRPW